MGVFCLYKSQFFKKPSHKTICKCVLFHTLSYFLYVNAHFIIQILRIAI